MDVSQYLEIFIDETNGHLQNLSDCIMSLEKDPENMDTINEIFRAAHSLKGMAGTMGFKRMQRLTHDMENVFQEVRSNNMNVTSSLVDVLFQCLDAIDAYLENVKESSEEGTDDNEAIIQELNDILAAGTGVVPVKEEKVEEKPKEAASGDRFQKKYMDMEFSEKEKEELRVSEEKGMKLYGVTVYIQEECLLKAARAFLVFKAVEDFGNIIAYNPSSQDIEDEKFGFDFSFYLASETELDKIKEVSKAVSEIEEVIGEQVAYKELTAAAARKEEAEAAAAKEAENAKSAENPQVPAAAPAQTKPQAPAQSGKKQNGGKPVTNRTVRVDIEKLDALMNQVSELIIAKNSLVSIGSTSDGATGGSNSQAFHEQIEYLERITTGLHESVMKVRMVPIESVVQKFPRMIRDLSKKLDKKMELYMTGEDTELDRTVVDQIGDPLQHLLRNSADHGLESAELRKKRGKPESGSIHLNAFQEGNNVIIEVSDDGNGIDTESVKSKAIERGLITPEQGAALSQKEIIDFLFMPSFSMAKQISDVSGRGVGLDVVKSNIEALGGDVEVKSILGEGSKFTVRLPLTLAIIQALMVEVRNEKYAISLGSIETIEEIMADEIKFVQAKEVIHIRGMVIPLIRLDQLLDCEPDDEERESLTVIIVRKGDKFAGLIVDELNGQQEIVIKSLGKYINNSTKIISGATVLGDGEVALILDVNTLF
ncbi:two-component system, chemotaxis family, sensor kinase CheA [Eubacterium sp. 14-2]|uniref:chemotaxis protein CheA n=1 Tax=Eubacterium sp. 14-2 TaxID=1235790 RepID=UPI000334D1F3|nr:chemotaxis protein CheA [Eubacterium sp. 14-2]EOT26019.1 two-component system, chemotaxis family, sensor kinase CheA [Eubacterium sp. 14-2]